MAQNEPPRMRIIDLQWREIPNGYECEAAVEFSRADGSKTMVREFWRHVESDDSYITVRHAARDSAPAQTYLVFGTKGEIEGEFRNDRTEMLTFHQDGAVRRTEQNVKTWLKGDAIREKIGGWYRDGTEAGLSKEQIFQLIWSLENLKT